MNSFTINDYNEPNTKLNLDDLYEQVKLSDYNTLISYNKILEKIHKRIKLTSRQKNNKQCCWYVIPEVIIGIPKYDVASCTAYLIQKLTENNLKINYTHPNLLFISWNHWIPDYVRTKIKKNTGVEVDGNGKIINKKNDDDDANNLLTNKPNNIIVNNEYKSTNSYRPTGNLIYNNDLMQSIQNKL